MHFVIFFNCRTKKMLLILPETVNIDIIFAQLMPLLNKSLATAFSKYGAVWASSSSPNGARDKCRDIFM